MRVSATLTLVGKLKRRTPRRCKHRYASSGIVSLVHTFLPTIGFSANVFLLVLIQGRYAHSFVFYGSSGLSKLFFCLPVCPRRDSICGIEITALAGHQSTRKIHSPRWTPRTKPAGDHFDPGHSLNPSSVRNTIRSDRTAHQGDQRPTTQTLASRTHSRHITRETLKRVARR